MEDSTNHSLDFQKFLLVIPFHNESKRISIEEFNDAFRKFNHIHFLLADDGSTDNTVEILKQFEETFQNVNTIVSIQNSGKAETIRKAILSINPNDYDYVGYIDADLATPVEEFVKMTHFASHHKSYNFIMGSRIKKLGSNIVRYKHRHYIGRIFATVISSFILEIPVYDTQCGAKIIESKLAERLFRQPFLTKWFFDVELLLRYKNSDSNFSNHIYEFSLNTWIEKGESKITLKDMFGFPFQLLKIYLRKNQLV